MTLKLGQLLQEQYKTRAAKRQRDSKNDYQPSKLESTPTYHTMGVMLGKIRQSLHQSKTSIELVRTSVAKPKDTIMHHRESKASEHRPERASETKHRTRN